MDSALLEAVPASDKADAGTVAEPNPLDHFHVITDEGQAIRSYLAGNRHALDALVERYRDDAYWAARRLIRDHSAAQDVVQEAFLRLLDHLEDYDPRRPFRSWFTQIARNLAIDWLRRNGRQVSCPEVVSEIHVNHGRRLERDERRARVEEVLAALPEKYRSILVMREMEEVRADEIALRIGVNYKTTRWRLHQARRLFRREWEARFGPFVN